MSVDEGKAPIMSVEHLTITAETDVIRRAERVAASHHTTVGEMVREFLKSVGQERASFDESKLPPLTRAALEIGKGASPSQRPYKELLSEAMAEKYERLK